MKRCIMIAAIFFTLSCSKDSDVPVDENLISISLPKTVSLSYSTGMEVLYEFTYNNKQQIVQIIMDRTSEGDETNIFISNFTYDDHGNLVQVATEDTAGETDVLITFEYQEDIITKVDFSWNDEALENEIFYLGAATNAYSMTGDLGNFPSAWNFDDQDLLEELIIAANHIGLDYSTTDKGIFYGAQIQPAVHIWYGLLFNLSPYETCFFSQKDLTGFNIDGNGFLYQDKLWSSNGDLLTFKLSQNIPLGLVIKYVITYEERTI